MHLVGRILLLFPTLRTNLSSEDTLPLIALSRTPQAASRPLGVGLVAALATDRQRQGEDACYVATCTDARVVTRSVTFDKLRRTRAQEERICGRLLAAAASEACGLTAPHTDAEMVLPLLWRKTDADRAEGNEAMKLSTNGLLPPLDQLLDESGAYSAVTHVLFAPSPTGAHASDAAGATDASGAPVPVCSEMVNAPLHSRVVLLPGSFNPLHVGHVQLAAAALEELRSREDTGGAGSRAAAVRPWEVVYELSAYNVDKPPLDRETVRARVLQFSGGGASAPQALRDDAGVRNVGARRNQCNAPVVVTRAPRFIDKARLFPSCSFVIGYDTAARLVDPKYYRGSADAMIEGLLALKLAGTRFLVAGRVASPPTPPASTPSSPAATTGDSREFLSLAALLPSVPSVLRDAFIEIPESMFRADISSTEIRASWATQNSDSARN